MAEKRDRPEARSGKKFFTSPVFPIRPRPRLEGADRSGNVLRDGRAEGFTMGP